jgi:hypothetical protein
MIFGLKTNIMKPHFSENKTDSFFKAMLLSRKLLFALYQMVNPDKYEVVNDGLLNSDDPHEYDCIIYNKENKLSPEIVIELSDDENFERTLLNARKTITDNGPQFFIYNFQLDKWVCIRKKGSEIVVINSALWNEIDLSELILVPSLVN